MRLRAIRLFVASTGYSNPPLEDKVELSNRATIFESERSLLNVERTAFLKLAGIGEADDGVYVCRATNDAGSNEAAVATLNVADAPKILSLVPAEVNQELWVDPGESIKLSVNAVGHKPLRFRWFKDGTNVSSFSEFSTYAIVFAAEKDAGTTRLKSRMLLEMSTPVMCGLKYATPQLLNTLLRFLQMERFCLEKLHNSRARPLVRPHLSSSGG